MGVPAKLSAVSCKRSTHALPPPIVGKGTIGRTVIRPSVPSVWTLKAGSVVKLETTPLAKLAVVKSTYDHSKVAVTAVSRALEELNGRTTPVACAGMKQSQKMRPPGPVMNLADTAPSPSTCPRATVAPSGCPVSRPPATKKVSDWEVMEAPAGIMKGVLYVALSTTRWMECSLRRSTAPVATLALSKFSTWKSVAVTDEIWTLELLDANKSGITPNVLGNVSVAPAARLKGTVSISIGIGPSM